MSISVKFFASLRESLHCSDVDVDIQQLPPQAHAGHLWQFVTQQAKLPDSVFCAINHEHAPFDRILHDGDEVAFFPPITGG